ncbi:hypothetical protein [Phascolarctobacterium faecium]|uniref:hypothetical protein n=1 Tax=Phascolarctobacterium faecium TaxID=33025 RepID=UPI003520C587
MTNNDVQKIISETAEATAKAIYNKIQLEAKKAKAEAVSKKLYNTRLLLQNYRLFKQYVENAVFDLVRLDEEKETPLEILDAMWQSYGPGKSEIAVESIKMSMTRTKIIMAHVDEMIGLYEAYCYRSGKEENMRRLDVLKSMYITETDKTAGEIAVDLADKYYMDVRSIYRDVNAAIDVMTALIFGIDGVQVKEKRK